jgi:hypothetical protein
VPPPAPAIVDAFERSPEDTLPLPVAPIKLSDVASADVSSLFDDPGFRHVVRAAVRDRAERLLEDVVAQVIAELEPLLKRHLSRRTDEPT